MCEKKHNNNKGFTLIELSIVIMIIGLLVGGVLVGMDLVEAAKVRNLVGQLKKIDAAKNTFVGKYGGLPGDTINAQRFGLVAQGAICTDVAGGPNGVPDIDEANAPTNSQTLGCNGNGDGMLLDGSNVATNFRKRFNWEIRNFWFHLKVAGYYPFGPNTIAGYQNAGAASGLPGVQQEGNAPGDGFPVTVFGNLGIHAVLDPAQFNNTFKNFYVMGGIDPRQAGVNGFFVTYANINAPGGQSRVSGFSPQQVFSIDSLMDDGLPDTGYVIAVSGLGGQSISQVVNPGQDCVLPAVANIRQYNVGLAQGVCQLKVEMK